MKKPVLLFLLSPMLFPACINSNGSENAVEIDTVHTIKIETKRKVNHSPDNPTYKAVRYNADSLTVRQFALNIMDGKVSPHDNDYTYAMFDSLCSPNAATRDFYFKAYKYCLYQKTDGAVSESMGQYAKCYIETVPLEALSNYEYFTKNQKDQYATDLGFEISVQTEPKDYRIEIPKFFAVIRKSIDSSEVKALSTLKEIEKKALRVVREDYQRVSGN